VDDKVREILREVETDRILTTQLFNVPISTPWETMRPLIAQRYGLPLTATWEDIHAHRIATGELTSNDVQQFEQKRCRYAQALGLSLDASWPRIRSAVEEAGLPHIEC